MPKVRKKDTSNLEGNQMTEIICSPYFNAIKTSNKAEGQKKVTDLVNIHSLSSQLPPLPANRKNFEFFNQDCITLANALLGQLIVHVINRQRLSGIIVEVECYLGNEDVASHSYKGKRTPRNEPMFMKSGTAYVYSIYGMYYCFNISSKENGSCVLVRALEPVEGTEEMHHYRQERRQASSKMLKLNQLCNGPSKLCQALNIQKDNCNKLDMSNSQEFWMEDGISVNPNSVIVSKRIGIESSGEEWANKPLRFYILGNPHVSVRDRPAEATFKDTG